MLNQPLYTGSFLNERHDWFSWQSVVIERKIKRWLANINGTVDLPARYNCLSKLPFLSVLTVDFQKSPSSDFIWRAPLAKWSTCSKSMLKVVFSWRIWRVISLWLLVSLLSLCFFISVVFATHSTNYHSLAVYRTRSNHRLLRCERKIHLIPRAKRHSFIQSVTFNHLLIMCMDLS